MKLQLGDSDEELPDDVPPPPFSDFLWRDIVGKLDAGARLLFALYHAPVELHVHAPASLLKAYSQACEAYGIKQ